MQICRSCCLHSAAHSATTFNFHHAVTFIDFHFQGSPVASPYLLLIAVSFQFNFYQSKISQISLTISTAINLHFHSQAHSKFPRLNSLHIFLMFEAKFVTNIFAVVAFFLLGTVPSYQVTGSLSQSRCSRSRKLELMVTGVN